MEVHPGLDRRGVVYWNMLAGLLIGIMVAFVVSEICFDLRLWWTSPRKR